MTALPDGVPAPDFVSRDAAAVTAALVADFEQRTDRVLQPAQAERVFLDWLAYREVLLRQAIQDAGEQALVATARWPLLDYHGDSYGVTRLEATAARLTLRVTLTAVQTLPVVLPAGVQVRTADGAAAFATVAECAVPAGQLTADVVAQCTVAGAVGNGYLPGQVGTIDPRPFVASVVNISASSGGADREDDERFRTRIVDSHVLPSTAGSLAGYRAHALASSSSIIDAAVSSPAPGLVRVTVLTAGGLPSADLRAQVAAALSAETVRPLTDAIEVVAPAQVPYQITATVVRFEGTDGGSVAAAVQAAAEAYAADRRLGLGRDIVPSQIVARLSVPGVYQVTLAAPVARVVAADEWANCTAIAVAISGAQRG